MRVVELDYTVRGGEPELGADRMVLVRRVQDIEILMRQLVVTRGCL